MFEFSLRHVCSFVFGCKSLQESNKSLPEINSLNLFTVSLLCGWPEITSIVLDDTVLKSPKTAICVLCLSIWSAVYVFSLSFNLYKKNCLLVSVSEGLYVFTMIKVCSWFLHDVIRILSSL